MKTNNENLFDILVANFPEDLSQTLLTTADGHEYTYSDALDDSGRMARCLSDLGLRAGDRVTAQVEKSPEVLWLYLACLRGGFVFHPLNMDYQLDELVFFVNNAKPAAVVCDPDKLQLFQELLQNTECAVMTLDASGKGSLSNAIAETAATFRTRERAADDTAVLLYSSGTTGVPKGVKLSHGNLTVNMRALVNAWGFTADDVLLHALPVCEAHGLLVATGCVLMSGASMVFLPRFEANEVIAALPHCSVMMGIPEHYKRLLDDKHFDAKHCSTIRVFISGSTPLPEKLFRDFEQRTQQRILERYGMTETGINATNPLGDERRPGSVGPALPGVELRVVDEAGTQLPHDAVGQLQVRGPNVFSGYWRKGERSSEESEFQFSHDGFFNTGDLAMIKSDGYVTIVGRDTADCAPSTADLETSEN